MLTLNQIIRMNWENNPKFDMFEAGELYKRLDDLNLRIQLVDAIIDSTYMETFLDVH